MGTECTTHTNQLTNLLVKMMSKANMETSPKLENKRGMTQVTNLVNERSIITTNPQTLKQQ